MAEALDVQTTHLSVLQRVSRSDVVRDPYPHVVVHDALPASLCQALIEQYPAPEAVGAGPKSDQRWSLPTTDALQSPDVPQVWKDFTRCHASPAFFSEVVDVFGAEIVRLYPQCFPDEEALRRLILDRVGEVDYALFDVPRHWQTRLRKLSRLAKKRVLRVVGLAEK